MASDGKSAYERLKKRLHRGELLAFGASVMFRVAGKVPGGLMTEMASGHVVGKTFPHRRTHCGTKGRRPRDQIKGREGDAGTDDDG